MEGIAESLGFVFGAMVFGLKVLPGFTRFPFFVVSLIFFSSDLFSTNIGLGLESLSSQFLLTPVGLSKFTQGLSASFVLSSSIFAGLFFASWFSTLIFGELKRSEGSSVFDLLVLFFLYLLFHSEAVFSLVSVSNGESLSVLKMNDILASALRHGLFLAAPFFFASLSFDLFSSFMQRFSSASVSSSISQASKILFLLLGLALSILPITESFVR